MEKKASSIRRTLGTVTLYLDDLEEIIGILQSEGFLVKLILENKKHRYEFDGIPAANEIKLMDNTTYHDLDITANGDVYLFVNLSTGSAHCSLSSATTKGLGVYGKVLSVLSPTPIALTITLYFLPLLILTVLFSTGTAVFGGFFWVLLAAVILLALGRINKMFFTYSTIHLKRKAEMPSFWQRKKDDILLSTVSALIGAAVTLGITQLLQKKPLTERPPQPDSVTHQQSVSNKAAVMETNTEHPPQ